MRFGSGWILCAVLAAGTSCDGESEPEGPQQPEGLLEPPADGQGFQIHMDVEAPPGEEIWKCQIGELPFVEGGFFLVNSAESRQPDSVHHMDVMALAFTPLDLPDGVYDCAEIYANNPILMEEGIFLYASQIAEQKIQLPPGVVATVPSQMRYMQEIHYVNTSSEPKKLSSYVNAYTIPSQEMTSSIWGGVVRDAHIEIPPMSEHVEWTRCVMNQDVDVVFLSSHTHQLGTRVTINRFDGTSTGEQIYENKDWHAPQLLDFNPGLKLRAGEGLEFSCTFKNTTDQVVNWGFKSTDEMCQIGLVFTPSSQTAACEVVETSDGVIDTSGQ